MGCSSGDTGSERMDVLPASPECWIMDDADYRAASICQTSHPCCAFVRRELLACSVIPFPV